VSPFDSDLSRRFSEYTNRLFAPEDAVLAELGRRTAASEVAPMQISAEVGQLLRVLALTVGARRILEIGTLFGYSAIWLGRALPPDGRLICLEMDPLRAAEAREWLARAGLAALADVRVGSALSLLPDLSTDPPFDLAFLDAAKTEYPQYLDWALRLVRPGGLIVADNTLFSSSQPGTVADPDAASPSLLAVQEFNRRIATDPRLASIVLPVREGVSISLVRG
jgi:predicted O-methyltransferase YrrM